MKFIITTLISAALLQFCGAYDATDNYRAYLQQLQLNSQIDPRTIQSAQSVPPQIQQLQLQLLQANTFNTRDAFLTMAQICQKYGFAYEEHEVTTEDGYILKLGRIPGLQSEGKVAEGSKPVIHLQHALSMDMMQWVRASPETTHAFLLARAGYDVWMGNNRGTRWGQRHVKLNVKDSAFWSFTWEEMGTKDLPAFINYILNMTKQDKLSYMAHSEGTTQLLAGGSLLPEFFNSRIAVAILLAPPASMAYSNNGPRKSSSMKGMLDGAMKAFASRNPKMGNAGAYNFVHYAQLALTNGPEFNRFDHGRVENMKKYGQMSPPHYNLKNIQFPVAIFGGTYDVLADMKDIAWLHEQIKPHVVHFEELPFVHSGFLLDKDISYVSKTVLPILNKYTPQANQQQLLSLNQLANAVTQYNQIQPQMLSAYSAQIPESYSFVILI